MLDIILTVVLVSAIGFLCFMVTPFGAAILWNKLDKNESLLGLCLAVIGCAILVLCIGGYMGILD